MRPMPILPSSLYQLPDAPPPPKLPPPPPLSLELLELLDQSLLPTPDQLLLLLPRPPLVGAAKSPSSANRNTINPALNAKAND